MKTASTLRPMALLTTKTSFAAILLLAGVAHLDLAHAAVVNNGDILTINPGGMCGAYGIPCPGGSYFALNIDANGNSDGSNNPFQRTSLSQGTNSLVIGITTTAGAHHVGLVVAGDSNAIDAPWNFQNFLPHDTGSDYVRTAITGSTTTGLNFSGWTMAWSTFSQIPLGTGAWTPTNCNTTPGCSGTLQDGIAEFVWDGIYGHSYLLNYAATIPAGDSSGFGGVPYFLHLEGTVNAVPLPTAAWLFGSGLVGLFGVTRRHRS